MLQVYGQICRVDKVQRMVWGYASTTTEAEDGQTIAIEALEDALDDYMRFANIREMHLPSAVGVAREAHVDAKGLYIGAHVVDDEAWNKVETEVYKGFSIKGPVTQRDPLNRSHITGLKIYEISLVDRPSDPDAVFDVWRAAGVDPDLPDDLPEDEMARKADTTKPAADAAKPDAAAAAPTPDAPAAEDVERAAGDQTEAADDTAAAGEVERAAEGGEGEDAVAEAEGAEGEGEPAPADPVAEAVARAATAGEALDAAAAKLRGDTPAAAELPGAEVRRSLGLVSRLGYVINELVYVISDADFEAQLEGDNSPVPEQLREALRGLAVAYKTMSAEEIDELLASTSAVMRSIDNGIGLLAVTGDELQRAADVTLTDDQGERLQAIFDGFVARGWKPAAAPASDEVQRLVEAHAADRETWSGEREVLTRTVGELADKVTGFAAMVAPPKTGGALARAVEKSEDAAGPGGQDEVQRGQALTVEEIQRGLEAMEPQERALLLTKAALARPQAIGR